MHMSQLTELYTLNVQLFVYQLYFNKADSLKKKTASSFLSHSKYISLSKISGPQRGTSHRSSGLAIVQVQEGQLTKQSGAWVLLLSLEKELITHETQ